ncbi:glycoside hydrolase family 38 N-terminal domain-containing protein [Chitinophaga lutea]|nr:hypothetical protein [Chitinophaga lutea]
MRRKNLYILVLTLFTFSATGQVRKASPAVTDVWVVVKSHFDLGFTDLAANVFERYRTEMMDKSLKVMAANRALPPNKRFVWTVPAWPLWAQMLGPQQDSARKVLVEQAVREGALAPHALPFSTHTESLELEDLARGLGFAAKIAHKYNRPLPVAAKMTDVPSHSWVMPTLLHHAGIRFLHIGVNPASQYPRVPQLFWWEGADGSKVLCAYTIDYGSDPFPPADWPCKNYLSMIMAGDNHGPPSPEDVEKWRKQYETKMPGVNVHFGTLDDFAKALLAEQPDLPVVRGDMPDTWIHGLMSMPQATGLARTARPLAPALESMDTHLRMWGLHTGDVAPRLAQAYEQSLLYGEHTWGMNAEYGPRRLYGEEWKQWLAAMEQEPLPAGGDYAKLPRGNKRKWLQSYNDHANYARTAAAIVNSELEARLQQLAASVKDKGVVVYNPLPWKRSGMVMVDGVRVFVENVPPNGYKTVPLVRHTPVQQAAAATLSTPHFTAHFDLQKGGIRSLVDKATGAELVDTASGYVIGQFLHERFSKREVFDRFFYKYSRIHDSWGLNDIGKPGMPDETQVPYRAVSPSDWKISVDATPAEDRVTLIAGNTEGLAKACTIVFTFPRNVPLVDVTWTVEDKTAEKHPEGGWLCFPFKIRQPSFLLGRLGAPVNPAKDIIPGTNRHIHAVNSGVLVTGGNTGVGLCAAEAPLVSLGEPGLWRFSMDYVPEKPVVFVNLYNNMWNTNFPLWQEGSWSERVRIWPVRGTETKENDLAVNAWEMRVPLLAAAAAGNGTLPAEREGLSVSRKGVLVTAFGKNPDSGGKTMLRVWEQSGITAPVIIRLPASLKVRYATPVDLRGEVTGKRIPVSKQAFNVPLHAYSPASWILE